MGRGREVKRGVLRAVGKKEKKRGGGTMQEADETPDEQESITRQANMMTPNPRRVNKDREGTRSHTSTKDRQYAQ